ncbi:hypothetical protein R9C00_14530 [Flammeovirgaceae bacterium SG7u.111]|nr:hypothetical protein [Flammeovirgaceae bacterium SG7u.132]WPO38674.1 hypothetical protein R9C00_14530 [Flammeovirgaceae bacterium SG7u.111]
MQIETAIEEIRSGKHTTDNINYAKHVAEELMITLQFNQALELLGNLAEARQVKTTNILWIGSFLKDLYFNEKAKYLRETYTKSLLEEMLYYYLKSCKLFDPGYDIVKQHIKRVPK